MIDIKILTNYFPHFKAKRLDIDQNKDNIIIKLTESFEKHKIKYNKKFAEDLLLKRSKLIFSLRNIGRLFIK